MVMVVDRKVMREKVNEKTEKNIKIFCRIHYIILYYYTDCSA